MVNSHASASADKQAAFHISFDKYQLDNGLRVILHEDHTAPVVAVSVMYHVGSKDERPDQTGFAHFFEHLMFEGSKHIERGSFDKYVERAGGTLNANTAFDRTYYYDLLPSHQVELGLWLESERMLHAKVDQIGIDTQRAVVIEERRQRYDNQPYGTVLEETLKRAYDRHPYRWPVIGDMDHLRASTKEDFANFYQTYYVPDNAVLVVAGDINKEGVKRLVDKYFASIPIGQEPIHRYSEVDPPLKREVRDRVYDDIQLPAVVHAWRIPPAGGPDHYVIDMFGQLLSQGESSIMHRELVDHMQCALAVYQFPLALEHPGLTMTYAIANAGIGADQLEQAMDEVIDHFIHHGVKDEDVIKLNNQIETSMLMRYSTMSGVAEGLATFETLRGGAEVINDQLKAYRQVKPEDISNAAQRYLRDAHRVALYVEPHPPQQSS